MTMPMLDVLDKARVQSAMQDAYWAAYKEHQNATSHMEGDIAAGRMCALVELARALGIEGLTLS